MISPHDKMRATVINTLLGGDVLQDECEILSFEDSSGRRYYQAIAISKSDPSIACVCSLPTTTRNVYVILTDGDIPTVRRIMAMLEETERDSGVLLGNVLLLDAPELKARGIVGVVLLSVQASNALNYLPATISVEGVELNVMLVVFLTKQEHNTWRDQGHDALMARFSTEGKDLVSFGA